jgi:hypothetical protein
VGHRRYTTAIEVDYNEFKQIYHQAYDAEIAVIGFVEGVGSGSYGEECTDTLRDASPATYDLGSETYGDTDRATADFVFEGIDPNTTDFCDGILIIENTISDNDVTATIYVWDPAASPPDWVIPTCTDCDNAYGEFFYHAPMSEDETWDSRRIFHLPQIAQYLDGDELTFRIVQSHAVSFTVKYDLVQLLQAPGVGCGGSFSLLENPPTPQYRGADFNYDHTVDEDDSTEFFAAYFNESPAADMDRDGDVDETDAGIFLGYYGE